MADHGSKTHAEIDKEIIERHNRLMKISQDREIRLHRHYEWRGNKLPPFSIEPLPHERTRLAGMTSADRAARRQWIKDQELSAREPVFIKELYPRNPIKRFFAAPWDAAYNIMKPVIGESTAMTTRIVAPKVVGAVILAYACYYNVKYLANDWTGKRGWHTYSSKPRIFPGDPGYPNQPVKSHDDFFDRGFKNRSCLLDVANSTGGQ